MITLRLAVPPQVLETSAPPLAVVHRVPYWTIGAALGVLALPLMALSLVR